MTIPPDQLAELRAMSKPELAASIANMVRETLLPEDGWTIEAGRDCVDVLLIAARIAYPTTADIESLPSAVDVAGELAEELQNDLNARTV